jgi:hypothetical protein
MPADRLAALLLVALVNGCSSHMYYAEAQLYGNALRDELVRLRACPSVQACSQNKMIFWEGGGWKLGPFRGGGVSIHVYRVSNPEVAEALLQKCRSIHSQYRSVPVSLVVYANPHIDNLNPGTPKIVLKERIS